MYAKLNNGVVEKYPYTIGDLRKDNPNTSFPAWLPQELLALFSLVPVVVTGAPEHDYTKNVIEGVPAFVPERNRWETQWSLEDASAGEIAERLETQWNIVRAQRNDLLASCDWTQLDDTPLGNSEKLAWAAYRQALRDLTDQPNPFNISWPAQP